MKAADMVTSTLLLLLLGCPYRVGPRSAGEVPGGSVSSEQVTVRAPRESELPAGHGGLMLAEQTSMGPDFGIDSSALLDSVVVEERLYEQGRLFDLPEEYELPDAFRQSHETDGTLLPATEAPSPGSGDDVGTLGVEPGTLLGLASEDYSEDPIDVTFVEAVLVHGAPPRFPRAARRQKVHGVVVVEAMVDGSGVVEEARVLRSVPLLDQAALSAVRRWRFVPAARDGVPVRMRLLLAVEFKPGAWQ